VKGGGGLNADDLKELIHEVLDERSHAARASRSRSSNRTIKKKAQTSKALILFASVMYMLTWIVAVYSWFNSGLLPEELMRYSTYLYGVALAVYGGKAAYENKAKIETMNEQGDTGFKNHEFP
jgi:hypothetical protein